METKPTARWVLLWLILVKVFVHHFQNSCYDKHTKKKISKNKMS